MRTSFFPAQNPFALYTSMHTWLPVLLSKLLSLLQATTLRERYYLALNRIELLETALDDIARISASRTASSERHKLIVGIITRTKNNEQ